MSALVITSMVIEGDCYQLDSLLSRYYENRLPEDILQGCSFDRFDVDHAARIAHVSYQSKNCHLIAEWNALLRQSYPGCRQVSISENDTYGVFVNTDREGKYFPERVYLDGDIGDNYLEEHYQNSEAEAIDAVNDWLSECGVAARAETLDEAAAIAKSLGGNFVYYFYSYQI